MKPLRWLLFVAIALASGGEGNAQDLSFLPPSIAQALESADRNFGKRHEVVYIDASSISSAARLLGVTTPSAGELIAQLTQSNERMYVAVDSMADALRHGRPTTPEYRAAVAHLRQSEALDQSDTVRWVRNGGVIIRINSIVRTGEGYRVFISSTVTFPAFTGLHGSHTAVDVILRHGKWIVSDR